MGYEPSPFGGGAGAARAPMPRSASMAIMQTDSLPPVEPQVIGEVFVKRNLGADDTINVGLTNAQDRPMIVALNTLGSGSLTPLLSEEYPAGLSPVGPLGLDLDASGNVYVASALEQCVLKLSPAGAALLRFLGPSHLYQGAVGPIFNGLPLSNPGQVAIDGTGRILIADTGNSRLVILTSAGAYSTGITGLTGISGVCVDSSNNIYVNIANDATSHFIRKYNSALVQQWSTFPLAFPTVRHITTDGTHIYFTSGNLVIKRLCSTGAAVSSWGGTGSADGQLITPWGIAYNSGDSLLYVVDSGNSRAQVFNTTGGFQRKWALASSRGRGAAVASGGSILIAEGSATGQRGKVTRSTTAGASQDVYYTSHDPDGIGTTTGNIFWAGDRERSILHKHDLDLPKFQPSGVRVRPSDGLVFVANQGERAYVFNTAGAAANAYGSTGAADVELSADGLKLWVVHHTDSNVKRYDAGTAALELTVGGPGSGDLEFSTPLGIRRDPDGNLWIGDTGNNRLQKIDPAGAFLAAYGSSGNADGQFAGPTAMAFDPAGRLWVMDTGNDRIQVFDTAFTFLGKVGSTGSGGSQLEAPGGVTFMASGVGLVGDTGNDRISRVFLPNPQFIVASDSPGDNDILIYDAGLGAWVEHSFVGSGRRVMEVDSAGLPGALSALGAVLINSGSFSGVASHSLPQGTFTSEHSTYLIVIKLSAQGTGQVYIRNRLAGVDAGAAASYYYAGDFVNSSAVTGAFGATVTGTVMLHETATARAEQTWYLWVTDPATAVFTQYNFSGSVRFTGAAVMWRVNGGGFHLVNTAYDALTLHTSVGTMTGTVRTYALRNT